MKKLGGSLHFYWCCLFRRHYISQRDALGVNSTYRDGIAHAVANNLQTGCKTLIQLGRTNIKNEEQKHGGIPQQALIGLTNALMSCSRSPKELQFEADKLNEKLRNRQFPASPEEVKEARSKIKRSLLADYESLDKRTNLTTEINEGMDQEIQEKVNKMLKKTRYNWKPLNFKNRESAAVYVLARLAANFAEVQAVLNEFARIKFVPQNVLDYGSGSGAAFWAAYAKWGRKVENFQLIEPDENMHNFSMDIIRGDVDDKQLFVHPNIDFRRTLAPSLDNKFDLVILHRVMVELPSQELRLNLLSNLWNRTRRYLVIVDGSCAGGYEAVMEARDALLMAGYELHRDETRQLLSDQGLLTAEMEAVIDDPTLSNYIRYNIVKEMLPNTELPTKLDIGHVFAPCPHDQGCPKLMDDASDVCKFSTRWNIVRADGKRQIQSNIKGSFSYVIMAKGDRSRKNIEHRLLTSVRGSGHINCTVCTAFNGLQRFTVSKRMGPLYKIMKRHKEGNLLPLEVKVVDSNSEYDFFDEAVKEFEQQNCKNKKNI